MKDLNVKPKQYARLSNEVKYKKKKKSIQCKACGTINISKNVKNFFSTDPTTLILCPIVSKFDKESKSGFFLFGWSGGGGGSVVDKGTSSAGKRYSLNIHI